jgi:predicted hydrocarbon binding protein
MELSGYYYPNKMARFYVQSIEKTIGPEAMRKVYEVAGIPLDLCPPPNDLAKTFDFAYFAAIGVGLEKLYGARGERSLALHAGRAVYAEGFAEYGILIGSGELAFKTIPLKAKLKVGIRAMAQAFHNFSDQVTTVEEADDYFIYTIHRCPVCWGRKSSRPICYIAQGVLEEGMKWVSGGKMVPIEEVNCVAMGDETCIFHISKEPVS